jgi:hypothetical protein
MRFFTQPLLPRTVHGGARVPLEEPSEENRDVSASPTQPITELAAMQPPHESSSPSLNGTIRLLPFSGAEGQLQEHQLNAADALAYLDAVGVQL